MSWNSELRRLLERLLGGMRSAEPGPDEIPCHEAAAHVYEWLDGELSGKRAAGIGLHLETCAHCYPLLVFERSFLEAVARATKYDSVPQGLRERVMSSLRAQGFSAT